MKQFEFEITNKKSGRVEHARATARTEAIARAQIVLAYAAQFEVMGLCSDVNPPHYILGEIDCSEFPETETEWLISKARYEEASHAIIL